jgi:AP-1 complex subunit mu
MRAQFQLPSVQSQDLEAKPPIQVKFEIPYFTTSGIQVKTKLSLFNLTVD